MSTESPRQELRDFAETGRLRQQVEGRLSFEATDLLVEVVRRYCAPRRVSGARARRIHKAAVEALGRDGGAS